MKRLAAVSMIVVLSLVSAYGVVEANPGSPDLEISDVLVRAADSAIPNQVSAEITVANVGDAAAGAFTIRWYSDLNSNTIGCSFDVPGLDSNRRGTATCTYTYPGPGEKFWEAVVDQEAEVGESNEDNNVQVGTVLVGGVVPRLASEYDLYVRRMDFILSGPGAGDTVTLAAMIATDGFPSGEPYFPASHFLWRKGPSFPWQEETCPDNTQDATCVKSLDFSYNQPGSYEVEVQADNRNEVTEADEGNNTKTKYLVFDFDGQQPEAGSQPDLVIENAHFEPFPVIKGQSFRAVMTIRNVGSVTVTDPFSAMWHFPDALGLEDCVWDIGADIGPGARAEFACPRTTNANPGHGPSRLTVDRDNVIAESDEVNNDVSVNVEIVRQSEDQPEPSGTKPDLLIEDAHFEPSHPVPGADFQAVMTVRNGSNVAVTEPFAALWEFHAALGVQDCRWTLDNDLGAGAAKTLRCTRNSSALPGQSPTSLTVDADNAIAERDEVNNDASVTLVLYAQDHPDPVGVPDLAIRNLSLLPNPVGRGQDLLVEFDVVNQGAGPAAASVAEWKTVPAGGLSFRCDVLALQVGESHHCSWQRTAPSRKARYGTRATADVDNAVYEGSLENNTVQETLTVQ